MLAGSCPKVVYISWAAAFEAKQSYHCKVAGIELEKHSSSGHEMLNQQC